MHGRGLLTFALVASIVIVVFVVAWKAVAGMLQLVAAIQVQFRGRTHRAGFSAAPKGKADKAAPKAARAGKAAR